MEISSIFPTDNTKTNKHPPACVADGSLTWRSAFLAAKWSRNGELTTRNETNAGAQRHEIAPWRLCAFATTRGSFESNYRLIRKQRPSSLEAFSTG